MGIVIMSAGLSNHWRSRHLVWRHDFITRAHRLSATTGEPRPLCQHTLLALILRDGKASIILMWLMVIPLFFMDSIAEPDFFSPSFYEYFTLDARYPIIAWGWGAVLWLLSFFVLTYARLLRDKPDSKNRARHLGWRCAALLILCAALHLWQFSQLNDAQKARLGWGMAFATANIDMPPSHNPAPGY